MNLTSRFVVCFIVLCLSGPSAASERPDLYKLGKQAYDKGNYVTALKNLYAFYVLNDEELAERQDLKDSLEAAIEQCETLLGVLLKAHANVSEGEVYILDGTKRTRGVAIEIDDLVSPHVPGEPRIIEDSIQPITPMSRPSPRTIGQ